jgi:hypothetical protein
MPNPMFLKVMGVTLQEYNTYSPAKKERFQNVAQKRVIELHENDIDGYSKLTTATYQATKEAEAKSEWEIQQDKENE